MVDRIVEAAGGSVAGKTIAILGLTFKPNTDDMRDAPSLVIVPGLQAKGATIRAYDPQGMHEAGRMLAGVDFRKGAYDCIEGADMAVIITEWDQFRALDFGRIKSVMKSNIVVDLRNIYSPDDMARHGFAYTSIGRPVT
jgi:UDPglucose 6-dehydrogenase